ncbi:hypothetical protein ACFE04_030518 [Oxalis oulophora]
MGSQTHAEGTSADEDGKGAMWELEQQLDQSLDREAFRLKSMHEQVLSTPLIIQLAFQSLGVVYGDLGTSPLYVFYNTFPEGIKHPDDVVGALSLIIYSLTLITLLKYVFFVCRANDNGQGGTFALYSLLCRHAKIRTIPNHDKSDEKLTTYKYSTFREKSFAAATKRWLEGQAFRKNTLLVLVIVGSCMVIGDGILTPAIAVLSAVGGIKVGQPNMSENVVVIVAVVILVILFAMQHQGTDKVSWLFAPIVLLWFLVIGGIGLFNVWKYDSKILKAFSPVCIYHYFKRGPKEAWLSLGGVMLSITGTEALFADLTLFPVSSIQIAFTVIVFPCLLCAYIGQAAYLVKHPEHVIDGFYRSIPGTAVVIVMLVTTFLMILIMLLVWRIHWIFVLFFTVLSLAIEGTYFSAVICKVNQGGWVPLVIALAFFVIMYIWHYGTVKRYEFELQSKVSMSWILRLGPSLGLVRVPGIGLVYTELARGVPHIFSHFITNLPAIHSVVIFVCVKYLPVYTVPEDERFLVRRIGPNDFRMFRCVARYGYKDLHRKDDEFETKLLDNLFKYVWLESMMEGSEPDISSVDPLTEQSLQGFPNLPDNTYSVDITATNYSEINYVQTVNENIASSSNANVDESEYLKSCRDAGVVHMLGSSIVVARNGSRWYKRIAIDFIYAFLKKICRNNSVIFNVPQESLLNVGQIIRV